MKGARTIGVLISAVVRAPNIPRIARVAAIGVVVAGCARLADLGAGSDLAATTADGGKNTGVEGRTDANIEITPATLDFGDVPCGVEARAQLINIRNSGGLPSKYKVELPTGTALRIDGALEGTIAPKGTVTLSVFANPRLAGENATDLFVTAGEALQPIHVTAKGTGATFELVQSTISFGEVRKQLGAPPVEVEVRNTGSAPVSVSDFTISAPDAFAVEWAGKPGAFNVAPGTSGKFKVALLTAANDDAAMLTATIKPKETAFCGAPPILTVTGRRVTSDVTLSTADWSKQGCNSTPNSKDIVITNYGAAIVNYTVTPATPSAFKIEDEGPHTLLAAATPSTPTTAKIRVSPNKLPGVAPLPNIIENLIVQLSSSAPGVTGPRTVVLHVDVRGVILTLNPATLAFTSTGAATDRKTFAVENTGNEGLYLNWDFSRTSPSGATSWSYNAPGSLGGPAVANVSVDFKGVGDAGVSTATLTPSQPFLFASPQCKSLGSVSLTGTKP